MKKTLVALAAFAAVGAYAQSNVTMYGVVEAGVDVGYKSVINNTGNTTTGGTVTTSKPTLRVQDGSSQGVGASRIGFKGTEDLGGGMKANFQLEAAISSDTGNTGGNSGSGTAQTFARQAWVGLSGGMGEVRLGRQYLPAYFVRANSSVGGDSNGLYEANSVVNYVGAGTRASNVINYISPSMNGFKVSGGYVAPEGKSSTATTAGAVTAETKSEPQYDLAAEYANGPLYLGAAYDSRKSGTSTTAETKTTGYTLGGSYDFGVVKPFANYTHIKTQLTAGSLSYTFGGLAGLTLSTGATTGEITEKGYSVGVKVPMGAVTLLASYARAKVNNTIATVAVDTKATGYQLGAQYALSKRTMLEANYGRQTVKGNSVSTGALVTGNDNKVSALNVGVRHSF